MSGTFTIIALGAGTQTGPIAARRWYQAVPAGPLLLDTDTVQGVTSPRTITTGPWPTPGNLVLGAINGGEDATGDWLCRFESIGASISVDGGALIDFNSLPAGFVADTAVLSIHLSSVFNGLSAFLQLDELTEKAITINSGFVTYTFAYTIVAQNPTMLDIVNNGFGIRFTQPNATGFVQGYLALISGTYHTYTITSITPNPIRTDQGAQTIHINGTNLTSAPTAAATIKYTNANGVLTSISVTLVVVDDTLITFALDAAALATLRNFSGTATLFSGAVSLSTMTILYATGSGIYKFVLNQRHDTLYDRTTGSTTDVAIPEPFAETGFIGG